MTTFTSRGVPMAESSDPADIAERVNDLADVEHARPGVSPLTTTQRNALAGAELWDGRVITNTTLDRLQRYDLGTDEWVTLADAPVMKLHTPTVTAESGSGFTATGFTRYTDDGLMIVARTRITISAAGSGAGGVKFTLPVPARDNPDTSSYLGGGRESASVGDILAVQLDGPTRGVILRDSSLSPIANGRVLNVTCIYEK